MEKIRIKHKQDANSKMLSKAGHKFCLEDDFWQLDKNTKINVESVRSKLDEVSAIGYINTLKYYAINLSAAHTKNINERFLHMVVTTGATSISDSILINYRSVLKRNTIWYIGTIRGFLKKWNHLGYDGVSDSIIEMLESWTIKGNIKGDVVKRLDPVFGPLSDIELLGFNEKAVQAYELDQISLTELALVLSVSSTGRRSLQISYLRLKDILMGENSKEEPKYLLNIPRAKQQGVEFRTEFKQFEISYELWVILNAQAEYVVQTVESILGFQLQVADKIELPVFPDLKEFKLRTPSKLRELLKIDKLHIKSTAVTEACKKVVHVAEVLSERTGELLNISSVRFRYTVGTRAAREGFGEMVIAELLDHSDTQNSGVYVKNIPEHAEKLDQAIGHYFAPYAQAFAGVLVNSEKDAKRGNDLDSRVKAGDTGVGTCGNYGFCGANVPVPCYTCIHFQPWLDGPHSTVYDLLIAERERIIKTTGDLQIAAVNDRTIIAVADVIQRCAMRREELENG